MNNIHDTLYTMGLMETLCFIATDNEDWWFVLEDAVFHIDLISWNHRNE